MSAPTGIEGQERRFLHNCKGCGGKFRVLIRADILRVHQALCPHCQTANFFDNRRGAYLADSPPATDGAPIAPAAEPKPAARPTPHAAAPPRSSRPPETTAARTSATPPPPEQKSTLRTPPAPPPLRKSSPAAAPARSPERRPPLIERRETVEAGPRAPALLRTQTKARPPQTTPRRAGWLTRGALPARAWLEKLPLPAAIKDALRPLLAGELSRTWRFYLAAGFAGAVLIPMILVASLRVTHLYFPAGVGPYANRLQFVSPNRIYDRNGELIGELFSEKTGSLRPEEIPAQVKSVLLFVEDEGFYYHGAVDWLAVTRAMAANVLSFGYSQGGSTVTQQLARILLSNREKSLFRKLRETALAYHLEENLTKDEILAAYLNLVYLGHGAHGFEVAADFYFDAKVDELNFVETLTLASLPSSPERFSPLRRPDGLKRKMDAVYERMRSEGFPAPAPEEYERQYRDMLASLNKRPTASVFGSRVNDAPYVAEYVRLKLVELLGQDFQYGAGLKIYTSIDRKLQLAAGRESRAFIAASAPNFPAVRYVDGKRVGGDDLERQIAQAYSQTSIALFALGQNAPVENRPRLETASIGIDPRTGRVLFMQGGAEFRSGSQLNRALNMRRQTGSAIKPVVYSAGVESGELTAATILDDRPIYVSLQGIAAAGERDYWLPGNYSGTYEGKLSVRRALAKSQNIPAIQAARMVGIDRLGEQFRKFFFPDERNFDRRWRADETAAIGSIEMSPLEMASAFTAFANNGTIVRPTLIERVVGPDGAELYKAGAQDEFRLGAPAERTVLPGPVAEILNSLMHDSAGYSGVPRSGFSGDYFGKTGTSNDYRDAWFVGGTPDVVAAVWVGYDAPAYSMAGGTGAGLAGPLWGRILKNAPRAARGFEFSPRAVRHAVCRETGRQPTAACRERGSELFYDEYGPPPAAPEDQARGPTQDWSVNRDSDFQ